MNKKSKFATSALIIFALSGTAHATVPSFLKNTVFHEASINSEIDGLLLYSISLAESAFSQGNSMVAPSRYAMRAGDKSYYPKNEAEAKKVLAEILATGAKNVDVGLMQINLRWHGHRVDSPYDLFNPKTNLSVASDILLEAMMSSPTDIKTAIGRYHNWTDATRSTAYANRVLQIYTNINNTRN